MKIKLLKSAREDLKEGFHFYELQQEGLGPYFLESLSSDIENGKVKSQEDVFNNIEKSLKDKLK